MSRRRLREGLVGELMGGHAWLSMVPAMLLYIFFSLCFWSTSSLIFLVYYSLFSSFQWYYIILLWCSSVILSAPKNHLPFPFASSSCSFPFHRMFPSLRLSYAMWSSHLFSSLLVVPCLMLRIASSSSDLYCSYCSSSSFSSYFQSSSTSSSSYASSYPSPHPSDQRCICSSCAFSCLIMSSLGFLSFDSLCVLFSFIVLSRLLLSSRPLSVLVLLLHMCLSVLRRFLFGIMSMSALQHIVLYHITICCVTPCYPQHRPLVNYVILSYLFVIIFSYRHVCPRLVSFPLYYMILVSSLRSSCLLFSWFIFYSDPLIFSPLLCSMLI